MKNSENMVVDNWIKQEVMGGEEKLKKLQMFCKFELMFYSVKELPI